MKVFYPRTLGQFRRIFVIVGVGLFSVIACYSYDPTIKTDFDGDGKADIAVYREGCRPPELIPVAPNTAPCPNYVQSYFYYMSSATNTFTSVAYGQSMDFAIPADYRGIGKTNIAVYRWFDPGSLPNDTNAWYIEGLGTSFFGNVYGRKSPRNFSQHAGPTPAYPTAELGELRRDLIDPANKRYAYTFYWQSGESFVAVQTGVDTATKRVHQFAVPQDYRGNDQVSEVAVFQIETDIPTGTKQSCYRVWSSPTVEEPKVCLTGNVTIPIPGDYDGNGLADYAGIEVGSSSLIWKITYNYGPSTAPVAASDQSHGATNAVPVAADYDGDGKTDIAYVEPASGNWQWTIRYSAPPYSVYGLTFGFKTDVVLAQPYYADPWY